MQSRSKNSWLSTLTQMVRTGTWKWMPPEAQGSYQSRTYLSCDDLPLSIFLDCLCDSKYDGLVLEGNPSDEEIRHAWMLIISEYLQLRDKDAGELWMLTRDINRLQNHLFIVTHCTEFLRHRYSEIVAKTLRGIGYVVPNGTEERIKYTEMLNVIIEKSKSKSVMLLQLLTEYATKLGASNKEKVTRTDFEDILIEIESMQKTSYKIEDLTVKKFVLLERKLIKQYERHVNRKD